MGTGMVFLLSLILIGAIQGFIIACLLYFGAKTLKANLYLATLVLLLTLANLNAYFLPQELSTLWQRIGDIIPLLIFMPIGPLLWLYIRACINDTYLSKKEWFHFLPVVFDLLPYLLATGFYLGFFQQKAQLFNFIEHYHIYVDLLRWLSISSYLWMSYRLLATVKKVKTNLLFKNCKQLLYAFGVFQLIWLVFLVPYCIPTWREQLIDNMGWFPIYIPLSVLIYVIGLISYQVLKLNTKTAKAKQTQHALAPTAVDEAIQLLTKAMESDLLYLRPDLDLALVMAHTGLPQKTISTVLNHHYHQSFNEFVNHYRIEAVKQRLREGKTRAYTLHGIALDCGFNSQATFQRTFKQMLGLTPSQYLQEMENNNQI